MKKCLLLTIVLFIITSCSIQLNNDYKNFSDLKELSFKNEAYSIIQDDDFIYYISKTGITKINMINKSKELLLEDSDISFIKLDKNKIYYGSLSDEKGLIKAIDIETKQIEVVWDGLEYKKDNNSVDYVALHGLDIYENDLYIWISATSILRYNPISKVSKLLFQDVSQIVFLGKYAYYTEHASRTYALYAMELDTEKSELLRGVSETKENEDLLKSDINVDSIIRVENDLYYTTIFPNALYKYALNAEDILLTNTDEFFSYLYTLDGVIFYILEDGKNGLYKFDITSKETLWLASIDDFCSAYGFMIVDNVIFYRSLDDEFSLRKILIDSG